MKIAVVGAPGTGKTSLVTALRPLLQSDTSLADASLEFESTVREQHRAYDLVLLMGLDLPQQAPTSAQCDTLLRQLLDKHAMVYSRLSRRLRETGHQSFREYLGWLESAESPEWQEFVNALTTNLTSFFREHHHFEIFSDLLKSKPAGTPWRVWCSAKR